MSGVIEQPYPSTDKEWQAQDDARALARADVIKNDPARLEKAQAQAAKMAEHDRQEANAMSKVARKKKSSAKRPTVTGSGNTKVNAGHNVFRKI